MSLNHRSQKYSLAKDRLVIVLFIFASLALLTITSLALAQGGNYALSWWTVDNGGGTSEGGAFALSGTLGQPDAAAQMSGGQFSLQGGFWPTGGISAGVPTAHPLYLPLLRK
jgi:hypothetical protein